MSSPRVSLSQDQKKQLLPCRTYKESYKMRENVDGVFVVIQDKVIPELVEIKLKMLSDM